MSLTAGKTKLEKTTRELSINWNQTKGRWKDAKWLDFEEQYMRDLMENVHTATAAIEALEKLSKEIRNDCE